MISCGIKIGLKDYMSKINSEADFFEISYDGTYLPLDYAEVVKLIKELKKPFFFHLSTSYIQNEDTYLLNYASKNTTVRNNSRFVLNKEVRELSKYNPKGFIVHSPTKRDFSKKRRLFGDAADAQNYSESLDWISELSKDIYIENSPEAISISDKVYFTKPFSNTNLSKSGVRSLLDTGHFYTTCLVLKKIFSLEVDSNFLKGFSYFHIATLNKEVPYDIHGGIFSSSDKVFPSINQLKKIIFKIKENCKLTGVDTYIICEPCGGSEIHLDNLTKLRALLNGDS